jgi:hypothetical protein
MSNDSKDPMSELEAMGKVAQALKDLDPAARQRVFAWANAAFNLGSGSAIAPKKLTFSALPTIVAAEQGQSEVPRPTFDSIADLYSLVQPQGDAERALIAGYWFQVVQGEADFDSQSVNTELKHLGHGISNITQALSGLINRKPQLVIQTRKSGSSQQARKRYKITHAGQQAVERLIRGGGVNQEAIES